MTTHSEPTADPAEAVRMAIALHEASKAHAPEWADKEALGEQLSGVQALVDTGLFSIRAAARIAGVGMGRARSFVKSSHSTGGVIAPEALVLIQQLTTAEDLRTSHLLSPESVRLTKEIVGTGTSLYMVERLTGIPETTLRRWSLLEGDLDG